jgi:hypothetical protein
MSLLSILVLMFILRDHEFRMVLLLFSMCLQSFSWQISSRRLRLAVIISFTSSNSVLLIHHEFEGSIRYGLIGLLNVWPIYTVKISEKQPKHPRRDASWRRWWHAGKGGDERKLWIWCKCKTLSGSVDLVTEWAEEHGRSMWKQSCGSSELRTRPSRKHGR